MNQLTDDEFLEFLGSFDEEVCEEDGKIHKCLDSLTKLSKSDTPPYDSIIYDPFEMYGLDWMAKASEKWKDDSSLCQRDPRECENDLPKTTDALYCKKGENGNLILHIIEFKFVNPKNPLKKIDFFINEQDDYYDNKFVNGLKKVIKNNFVGRIENSLQLKPYEAIFIVLPELYDEYCEFKEKEDDTFEKKDIKSYLSNMEKYYWICIDNGSYGSSNEHNLRSKAKHFEKYCKRMEPAIFKQTAAKTKTQFRKSLKEEIIPN